MKNGTCKYFNGSRNECCEAGIRYDDVTPEPGNTLGKGFRIPCHSRLFFSAPTELQQKEFDRRGTCEKYTEPTEQEIADFEATMGKAMNRMIALTPLIGRIKELHQGQDWSGVDACPTCGGILHLTHAASNGHVHGHCETKGCVSWME